MYSVLWNSAQGEFRSFQSRLFGSGFLVAEGSEHGGTQGAAWLYGMPCCGPHETHTVYLYRYYTYWDLAKLQECRCSLSVDSRWMRTVTQLGADLYITDGSSCCPKTFGRPEAFDPYLGPQLTLQTSCCPNDGTTFPQNKSSPCVGPRAFHLEGFLFLIGVWGASDYGLLRFSTQAR